MAQADRDTIAVLIAEMEAQQAAVAELLAHAKATVGLAADNTKYRARRVNRPAAKRKVPKRSQP